MWERIKFWLMGYKDCAGCCLGCSYFDQCKADVFSSVTETELQEAYERDLVIESIINERRTHSYKKSA